MGQVLETIRVGSRDPWVGTLHPVPGGQVVVGRTGRAYEVCWKCNGTGFLREYAGIFEGQCFPCNGTGVLKRWDSLPEAERVFARREKAAKARAKRHAREAEEKAEQARLAAVAWRSDHPALVESLADYLGRESADWTTMRLAEAAREVDAGLVPGSSPEHLLEWLAEAQAKAQTRWAGEVGEPVEVTGEVVVAITVDGYAYGTSQRMVVVKAGEVTVKVYSSAQAAYELGRGDTVTLTGVVKSNGEYDGVKQSTLSRPKWKEVTHVPEPE